MNEFDLLQVNVEALIDDGKKEPSTSPPDDVPFSYGYDEWHDVLYISLYPKPREAYCEEIFPNILMRMDMETHDLVGLTIIDAKHQFDSGKLENGLFLLFKSENTIREVLSKAVISPIKQKDE